jgi:hypothetical protein
MAIAENLGMTYNDALDKLTMEEIHLWISFMKQKTEASKQDEGNLVGRSSDDILRGFGL